MIFIYFLIIFKQSLNMMYKLKIIVNYLYMINLINITPKHQYKKAVLKQSLFFKLKSLHKLENIKILSMPSKIKDKDILALFNGVISLVKEKVAQEQTQKLITLKLKYNKIKYLYNKLKLNLKNKNINFKNENNML